MYYDSLVPEITLPKRRIQMTERQLNPIKQMAIDLAHQMDDERKCREEFVPQYKQEEIRECGKYLRDQIWKKGYDINQLLFLAEQYKTLKMSEYMEWVRS